ncbi:hypothetical protein M405DRAFT_171462 [Rhizopogon salebrosus TDB-379]|nr:hypothetical protein M405DRAFT_171462 [Rhizopogon salebrosus TDB-379]
MRKTYEVNLWFIESMERVKSVFHECSYAKIIADLFLIAECLGALRVDHWRVHWGTRCCEGWRDDRCCE